MINDISLTNLQFASRNKQLEIMRLAPGKERRALLLDLLEGTYILANVKYQWNIEKDKDLQYLLKKNKIKRMKYLSGSKTVTALVKV